MCLGLIDGRRGLDRRDVGAEAARSTRRVRKGGRSGSVLLAAPKGSKRGEGVGGFVGSRRDVIVVRDGRTRLAALLGCRLVVEEGVDAAHGGCRVGAQSLGWACRALSSHGEGAARCRVTAGGVEAKSCGGLTRWKTAPSLSGGARASLIDRRMQNDNTTARPQYFVAAVWWSR